MNSKLKLGEVYLFKDEWKIALSCFECGLETEGLEHFLLHSLEHSVSLTENDVYGLLQQLNGYVMPDIKQEEETEVEFNENDPLACAITEATVLNEPLAIAKSTTAVEHPDLDTLNEQMCVAHGSPSPVADTKSTKNKPRRHKADAGYQCSICDKLYEKSSTYYMHMRMHRNPWRCEICGLISDSSYQHTVHRNRHLGIKPYDCTECGKKFTSKAEVKIHLRSHTGERPYACQECGRSYTNSSHLAVHRRRHTNERRYVCTHCGKSFFTLAQMREHEDTHGDERKQVCKVCSKTFMRRAALQQHMKLHAEKKYECTLCGKKFAQNAGLYSHMKSHKKAKGKLQLAGDAID